MISTILLSGGVGSRSGKNLPKQYSEIFGKMIISYCLNSICEAEVTDELIIVYGEGFLELLQQIMLEYQDQFGSIKYVLGGNSRQDSVLNGLRVCSHDKVLLHESARPLVTSENIKSIILHPSENVTMGMDIPFTILRQMNGYIKEVLKRDELFNVQLPQKFNKTKLLQAHISAEKEHRVFTDDSSLLFHYGTDVCVLKGSSENIKITTPGDFVVAEEILNSRKNR
ncbi:MAG: 2-C-methyl-D-erythritol 4-phosphate cytidylyltransferase [Spirochaetaceae bacterium]